MSDLPALNLVPRGPVRGLVVWLHGLGADGHDFAPLIPQLGLLERGIQVLLPHAPSRPVTLNAGLRMPAWYDLRDPDLTRDPDLRGIHEAVVEVQALAAAALAASGLAADRLLLAGFSQGGVVALQLGLALAEAPAAVLGLSTYLPAPLPPPGRSRRFLLMHGDADPVVPPALAVQAATALRDLGQDVELQRYPVAHGLCPAQIPVLRQWLAAVLP